MLINRSRIGALALIAVMVMGGAGGFAPVGRADEEDQKRARAAMLRGEVEPLPQALSVVEKAYPGDVIEVELEQEDIFGDGPVLIYEIKLVTDEGAVLNVRVHAKTLEILTVEGND